jgi:branched-chain amino acid transport system substrate-binding protein
VIIPVLAKATAGRVWGAGSRTALLSAVQATDMDGVTGHLSLDRYGDTTNQLVTVYEVQGGAFAPVAGSTCNAAG